MNRFFVPPECIVGESVEFSPEQRKQLKNVLRVTPGYRVSVFDGSGIEHLVEITTIDKELAAGRILAFHQPDTEPDIRLTLFQSMPKGEKAEMILQKCTEVGVAEFIFFESERSVPRLSPDKYASRIVRWKTIIQEAAEQSGRVRLPEIGSTESFPKALKSALSCDQAFILTPGDQKFGVESWTFDVGSSIALFIGPEGGFSDKEIAMALEYEVKPTSLGPRVLRTETAAVVASALAIYR